MTTHVTLTELRANLAKYFDELEADRTELVVTRQGREPMVVLPLSDWQGMQETTYLLSNPANAARLLDSIAELDAGRGLERDLVKP